MKIENMFWIVYSQTGDKFTGWRYTLPYENRVDAEKTQKRFYEKKGYASLICDYEQITKIWSFGEIAKSR